MQDEGRELIVVKLGGSCFSDKNKPRSFLPDVVDGICRQLHALDRDVVLVHGGGSFGHPLAKQFALHEGKRDDIPDQHVGFCLTHKAMMDLNGMIVDRCLNNSIPAFPVQPSILFSWKDRAIDRCETWPVDMLLGNGFVPVMHGDVIIDGARGYGIISGDEIVVEITNRLARPVEKIIYLLDVDGLHDKDPKAHPGDACLMPHVILSRDGRWRQGTGGRTQQECEIPAGSAGIDVTGGIARKLGDLKRLKRNPPDIYLVNGRAPDRIAGLFSSTPPRCTRVTISDVMEP